MTERTGTFGLIRSQMVHPPTNWHSHFGGPAWEFDPQRGQYYLHNFLASQPDLNFHNPDVVDAILDTCKFWLDRGLDGFRLDTVNYYFHDEKLRSNPPAQGSSQEMADLLGIPSDSCSCSSSL